MWTSVVFLAASSLLPAQGSSLTLTNVRPTSGMLGTPRADSKYLPGDSLFLAFDIDGIKIDDNGLALYSIGMEVVNSQGKSVFKQEPKNLEALNALGGNRLPAHVHLDIGLEQPPGDYSIKLIVNDRAAKSTQSVTHKFTVLAKGFGLVRLATTDDLEGQVPATPLSVVGQLLYVQCGVVGFGRDAKKLPHVTVEMRVLDEKGKPTLAKPFTGVVNKDIPEKATSFPVQFLLPLNRSGKFTIEMKATDHITKKTAELSFPHTVVEPK